MKAASCCEFGEPLVVEEVELDPPKTGEVKVMLGATAICHSDLLPGAATGAAGRQWWLGTMRPVLSR